MDADVREATDRTKGSWWLNNAWIRGLCINDIDVRQRRAADHDRQRMLARVARLKMDRVTVLVVMRGGPMMLMCSEPVMVFGMIVIYVRVDVQRGNLAGRCGQGQSKQGRY